VALLDQVDPALVLLQGALVLLGIARRRGCDLAGRPGRLRGARGGGLAGLLLRGRHPWGLHVKGSKDGALWKAWNSSAAAVGRASGLSRRAVNRPLPQRASIERTAFGRRSCRRTDSHRVLFDRCFCCSLPAA